MNNLGNRLKERGISLLEVMLSLAIIAIILVMATKYFGLASRGVNINSATQQVNEVRQGLTRYLQDFGTLNGVSLATLYNDGYITKQTGNGTGPWGPISITPNGTTASISISTGTDSQACQNLANQFSNIGGTCMGNGTVMTIPNGVQ